MLYFLPMFYLNTKRGTSEARRAFWSTRGKTWRHRSRMEASSRRIYWWSRPVWLWCRIRRDFRRLKGL